MKPIYISLSIILLLISSCKTAKRAIQTTRNKDSILRVRHTMHDTIIKTDKKIITEPSYQYLQIPCDSTKIHTVYRQGKTQYRIIKEKGQVRIEFIKDSLTERDRKFYQSVSKQKDSLSQVLKSHSKIQTEVIKKTGWQSFFSNLWRIAFCIILLLWLLNITPYSLFKLLSKG